MLSSSEFHSDFKNFRISLNEIGINGLSLVRPMAAEALTALLKEPNNALFSWRAFDPTTVVYKISRENDQAFKVQAQATLPLTCPCVKCLEPVVHHIDVDFAILMMEGTELLGEDEDPNLCFFDSDAADGDLDTSVGYFSGRAIDLGLVLREQIFLEVPDYPYCTAETALLKSTCKPAVALISEKEPNRENPFVKFWKTN